MSLKGEWPSIIGWALLVWGLVLLTIAISALTCKYILWLIKVLAPWH